MKVLLSAYACEPGVGSEPGKSWRWATELAKAGVEVWVLTNPDGKVAIERTLEESPHENLHFVYVSHSRFGQFLERIPWGGYWNAVRWQERALRVARLLHDQVGFDLTHHVSYGSIHIGSHLWRLGIPLIFGPVGGGQTAPRGYNKYLRGGLITEFVRTLVASNFSAILLNAKSTVRGATLVLVANEDTERVARSLGAPNVRLMTDAALPASQISSTSPVEKSKLRPIRIIWVGKLRPRKGLLLALEALSAVDSRVAWKLTIIGDGQQGHLLPEWLKQLAIEDKVEWRGNITWAEVQKSYDDADLFLFTSLRDTTGVQMLEAMSRGVPILTLDHQGASTLVPDAAGIKVQVTTPLETANRLARAVETLAGDRETLIRMGEAAIKVASALTFDKKVGAAIEIYKTVMPPTYNKTT